MSSTRFGREERAWRPWARGNGDGCEVDGYVRRELHMKLVLWDDDDDDVVTWPLW